MESSNPFPPSAAEVTRFLASDGNRVVQSGQRTGLKRSEKTINKRPRLSRFQQDNSKGQFHQEGRECWRPRKCTIGNSHSPPPPPPPLPLPPKDSKNVGGTLHRMALGTPGGEN